MTQETILTTGALSGLGKYIHENLKGLTFTRTTPEQKIRDIEKKGVDVIIHCAFNSKKSINLNQLYNYLKDNVFLTKKLTSIPHKKFIFVSSIDVYPKNQDTHSEKELIPLNSLNNIYAITKLMSETIVKNNCNDYLILRCSALLGKCSRKNSLIRIIENEECNLTLSGKSEFNYILHSDILDFIKLAIEKNIQGTYNLASSQNITLSEVAKMLDKRVNFGSYVYRTGHIDNSKIISVFPVFKNTSKKVVNKLIKQFYHV